MGTTRYSRPRIELVSKSTVGQVHFGRMAYPLANTAIAHDECRLVELLIDRLTLDGQCHFSAVAAPGIELAAITLCLWECPFVSRWFVGGAMTSAIAPVFVNVSFNDAMSSWRILLLDL